MASIVGSHGSQICCTSFNYGKCELLNERREIESFATGQTFYSLDCNSRNVHIAPLDEVKDTNQYVYKIGQLRKELAKPGGPGSRGNISIDGNPAPTWYTQKYIEKEGEDGFKYLLAFETLYLKDDQVNCRLGQLQYFRYKGYGVNRGLSDNAELLYPRSSFGKEMMYDKASEHCIFNSIHTIYDSPKEINDEFEAFRNGPVDDLSWKEYKQASTR